MRRAVEDFLLRDDAGGFQADVVGAGVQIGQVVREEAAANFPADAVALAEDVGRRAPELDGVLVLVVRLEHPELLRFGCIPWR